MIKQIDLSLLVRTWDTKGTFIDYKFENRKFSFIVTRE